MQVNVPAATAVHKLLNFYPPPDVADPEEFIAGLIALFALYPAAVWAVAIDPARGIPKRLKYLRIADVTEILDELNEPHQRETARLLAEQSHRRALAPPIDRSKRPTLDELKAQGLVKSRVEHPPLPPAQLWARWVEQRTMARVWLGPEARAILESAGYVIDGPADQDPTVQAKLEAPCIEGEALPS